MRRLLLATLAALLLAPAAAAGSDADVRFATFNASLNRNFAGQLRTDLSNTLNAQAAAVAEVIQRVRPDVLLVNEFDFDPAAPSTLDLFQTNYLSVPHNGASAIDYPYRYFAPSNTGVPSGKDFSNDGAIGGPNDAYGFGFFPGQFGMAVYSMHPIDPLGIRTFQLFRWADMPGALLPDDPRTAAPADWYSPDELAVFRLSSKSHWDLPITIGKKLVHFLVSHPTPPVFDDPPAFPAGVDFNGRRNFDEIRLWADYISPGQSDYIYDDAGRTGGLKPGSLFVVAGDQNSDPLDGDSIPGSIQQLLEHPLVNTKVTPESAGAAEAAALQMGANLTHRSDPRFDTADFADTAPGNLRADYVLPRKNLRIHGAGVFWPVQADPLFRLTGVFPFPTSDHRLVWVDLSVPG
jgi:Endonuclease/Exonuclease/phosphatase family